LDLNALFPIPRRVLRKGFADVGQAWMWRNWGVRSPIRKVKFAMEQRREGRAGLKPVAVFQFVSEDWSPWIALVRMRERWPQLRFDLGCEYLEAGRIPGDSAAGRGITASHSRLRSTCSGDPSVGAGSPSHTQVW
jgi:hypothetical protein